MSTPIISEWLTHFVGRSTPLDDEKNFQTLLSILRGHEPSGPDSDAPGLDKSLRLGRTVAARNVKLDPGVMRIDPLGSICDETLLSWRPNCFCDIPEGSFGRHIRHYGAFGLAFEKQFLILQGANPVFYVAKGSVAYPAKTRDRELWQEPRVFDPEGSVVDGDDAVLRGQFLDELVIGLHKTLMHGPESDQPSQAAEEARFARSRMYFSLLPAVFAFVKCFDETLAEDDPNNFYMEREWRVPRYVYFSLSDVKSVYVRREGNFRTRLKEEFPSLRVYDLPSVS